MNPPFTFSPKAENYAKGASGMNKAAGSIRDCVEKIIPIIAFIVLFVVFVFQVFMRYVVKSPQAWTVLFFMAGSAGCLLCPAYQRSCYFYTGL